MGRIKGKPIKRRLTPKQRNLVRELAKWKNLGKAAIAAGYSDKFPASSAHQALKAIQKTAPELLAKHGLDDDALIKEHLWPLLKAEKVSYFPYTRKGKRLLLTRVNADNSIRATALDTTFKVRGLYVKEAENKGVEFSVIVIDASHRPDWDAMRKARPAVEIPAPTGD